MSRLITKTSLLIVSLQLLCSASAIAGQNEPKKKPPKEAIEACLDKQEGQKVTFKGRKGKDLNATCVYIRGELVALPKGHKRKDG